MFDAFSKDFIPNRKLSDQGKHLRLKHPKMVSNFQAHTLDETTLSWEEEFWILVLFLWKSWDWLGNLADESPKKITRMF